MSHFVKIVRQVPDQEKDRISELVLEPGGKAKFGLWGFRDWKTNAPIVPKVVSGPGYIKETRQMTPDIMGYEATGLSEHSIIQARMGEIDCTAPLPLKYGGGDKAQRNKDLIDSDDPKEVPTIPGRQVRKVPLRTGFGGPLRRVNGLCIHITAGQGLCTSQTANFESKGLSTHFVIDRSGDIAQYVAASLTSFGQSDPSNPYWISVEMVGSQGGTHGERNQGMTTAQIGTVSSLWYWVYSTFDLPQWKIAAPYVGHKYKVDWTGGKPHVQRNEKGEKQFGGVLGAGLDEYYRTLAHAFNDRGYTFGPPSEDLNVCINSSGISCHYWLDHFPKPCPGATIMRQMPQILGYDELPDTDGGAAKFVNEQDKNEWVQPIELGDIG